MCMYFIGATGKRIYDMGYTLYNQHTRLHINYKPVKPTTSLIGQIFKFKPRSSEN